MSTPAGLDGGVTVGGQQAGKPLLGHAVAYMLVGNMYPRPEVSYVHTAFAVLPEQQYGFQSKPAQPMLPKKPPSSACCWILQRAPEYCAIDTGRDDGVAGVEGCAGEWSAGGEGCAGRSSAEQLRVCLKALQHAHVVGICMVGLESGF